MIIFVATETGFIAQERLTQNRMTYNINAGDEAGEYVYPDRGKDYIYKAQGTISVDFTEDASRPDINVVSNSISFGNKEVEALLDKRNFLQVFIDEVKKMLGYGKVENLGSIEFQETDQPSCGLSM